MNHISRTCYYCSVSCLLKPVGSFFVQHKVQEVIVLDRPTLTKKLRVLLSELAGRVAGRNKDDVTEALAIVLHSCLKSLLFSLAKP